MTSRTAEVPDTVLELVERFRENRSDYMQGGYKEFRLRREFLDPLFSALGWDMDNKAGYAEAYKDVVHEDSILVGGQAKAPDYSFRVGGTRKFFVEAKKPSVKVKDDIAAAYQLRRYAWSAKLPLSILTDFDEFAVYDTRIKPDPGDRASTARLLYMTSEEYPTRWHEIAEIFSRDAILRGSFDRFAQVKRSKGTALVDSAFLADIETWREQLAQDIAQRNTHLSLTRQDLNYAVQATLDRIIFLRICEDRGLEGDDLAQAAKKKNIYTRLLRIFEAADQRYNSGLFHFSAEKGWDEEPDQLTPQLVIDDSTLRPIINGLYYPTSPYEFSVIGADILGRVYEQFLGKTISLDGARVAVEEKPEVKKAGGVYYTPEFIVDYIVRSTLDPLLEGKTPQQAAKLSVADPACGSGSFLVAAYQYLLDWHLARYLEYKRRPKQIHQTATGAWRLTTRERKRILLDNIFGVDIDPQAVEVAKLSLLLKVIEGETQTEIAVERLLPDLTHNIKCGNSLISSDYYAENPLPDLSDDVDTINAFDWKAEYPRIFQTGGFDAVIGNPPYLNVDDTWGSGDPRLAYLKRAYSPVYNDKTDLLFYFLYRAVKLSKSDVSFIVSRAFLEAYKADKLRGWLGHEVDVHEIVDFRNAYIFDGVGITTAIVHLKKDRAGKPASIRQLVSDKLPYGASSDDIGRTGFSELTVHQDAFASDSWVFADTEIQGLLKKIDGAGDPLGEVLLIGQGMQTGRNNVFGSLTRGTLQGWGVPPEGLYQRVRNSDVHRYRFTHADNFLLFTPAFDSFDQLPSSARAHLREHEQELKDRAAYKRGNCEWWQWTWPLHKQYMGRSKIYCPYLATGNRFALDTSGNVLGLTDTTVLFEQGQPEDLRYILGLLNSKLLTFRFRFIGKLKSGGILEYFWNSVSKLPICRIGATDAKHERMVELVQRMMDLHELNDRVRVAHEKSRIQAQIRVTEELIDALVYELYGMSDADIELVEGALAATPEALDEESLSLL